jgi:prevent-host-death family protein
MEINATQFQQNCLQFIEQVFTLHTEIVITQQGKPLVKLVPLSEKNSIPFLGSLPGVGKTVGNLLEPFEDEWDID